MKHLKPDKEVAKEFLSYWNGFAIPVEALVDLLKDYAAEQNKYLMESLHLEVEIEKAIKRNARAEALEESARVAEEHCCLHSGETRRIVEKIRALKEKP